MAKSKSRSHDCRAMMSKAMNEMQTAPAGWRKKIVHEMIAVISALAKSGQRLQDTVIYGDSSGGGLAAAVVLKMRDRGLGMPAAAVLVSPWLDVTLSGDTETTLHDADPNQLYEKHGKQAAAALANPGDQKDPYASPVYGYYSKGFPPTLIQGGLKETLLSGLSGCARPSMLPECRSSWISTKA